MTNLIKTKQKAALWSAEGGGRRNCNNYQGYGYRDGCPSAAAEGGDVRLSDLTPRFTIMVSITVATVAFPYDSRGCLPAWYAGKVPNSL